MLKTIWSGFIGLFIDDGTFAIVMWLLAVRLILPRLGLPDGLRPVLLFAGLAVILVESAARRARAAG